MKGLSCQRVVRIERCVSLRDRIDHQDNISTLVIFRLQLHTQPLSRQLYEMTGIELDCEGKPFAADSRPGMAESQAPWMSLCRCGDGLPLAGECHYDGCSLDQHSLGEISPLRATRFGRDDGGVEG